MPHLNSRGEVAHGVGGGLASVNNAPFSKGGVFGWLDDDTVVFANGDDNWFISSYHRPTGKISRITATQANVGYAGGGVWASWLATSDATRGIYASTGFRSHDAGLLGVGVDGTIVYKPSYHANGPSIGRELDGTEWQITDGHTAALQMFGGRRAIWMEGMTIRTANLPPVQYISEGGVWKAQAALANEWWVAYYNGSKGIVLHPFNSLAGFSVLPTGNGWHTICSLSATVIRVAISRGEGEQPGEIWVRDYDVQNNVMRNPWGNQEEQRWVPVARVNLQTGAPQNPTDPNPIPLTSMRIQAFERKMWMAPFFSHSERYGETPLLEHAGNAIILVENATDPEGLGRELKKYGPLATPLIVDASKRMYPEFVNTTVAYWAGSAESAQTALSLSSSPMFEKPIIWYEDTGETVRWPATRPDWLTERVWPAVQAYRIPGELLTTFEARISSMLDRVSQYGRPVALVARFDDFNGTGSVAETLEAMQVYVRLINTYQIVAFLPFADRRGNGIAKNQELKDWALAFKAAMPARPNRFDYWQPSGMDFVTVLRNKFGQTTSLITLTTAEKNFILSKLEGTVIPPPPPPTQQWPNLSAQLKAERAKYPEKVSADECVAIINAVAALHPGLGLLKKPNGNHGLQPKTGIPCSVDWIILQDGRGADVLGAAGDSNTGELGVGTPSWPNEPTGKEDPARWIAPVI